MIEQPRRDLITELRFDPEEGICDLDPHLDRLKNQAESFGFSFDHHAARNELQAATFGKKERAIVRLAISPSGSMAIEVRPGRSTRERGSTSSLLP